jgi:hypothetical protein
MNLEWQKAAFIAVALLGITWLLRRFTRRTGPAALAREASIVLALYALWQRAGELSVLKLDGALSRGQWLWDAERTLHLPSEATIQRLFLHSSTAIQGLNLYYGIVHFPSLIVFLIWLCARHRERYPEIRNIIVLVTGASLAIQLIPVAPPRLIPGLHLVDTAAAYGQSVYGSIGTGSADQLSAMPSVHVAWAVIVAWTLWRFAGTRWRWLGVAHCTITVLAVTATANHYWLDGIVSVGLILVAVQILRAVALVIAVVRPRLGRRTELVPIS